MYLNSSLLFVKRWLFLIQIDRFVQSTFNFAESIRLRIWRHFIFSFSISSFLLSLSYSIILSLSFIVRFMNLYNIILTNLLLLLFLTVFALPKASSNGLDSSITSFTLWTLSPPPLTLDTYAIMYLAATVLPAPDSPLKLVF